LKGELRNASPYLFAVYLYLFAIYVEILYYFVGLCELLR